MTMTVLPFGTASRERYYHDADTDIAVWHAMVIVFIAAIDVASEEGQENWALKPELRVLDLERDPLMEKSCAASQFSNVMMNGESTFWH